MQTRKRKHVVDLVFLKFESFDDVLDLKFEQIYKENLVVKRNDYLVQPDFYLFDFGSKSHISDNFLSL